MYRELKSRSIIKTLSWRFFATLTTCLLVYLFTGRLLIAASVGGLEVIVKLILYFLHERIWDKIKFGKRLNEPFVIWLTGLSGAGKSTLAEKITDEIKRRGYRIEYLDGDRVREIFPKTGFSKEDRDRHIKRIGFLASILENNGIIVVSSFVSPYRDARQFVRNLCKNFIEVYVNASVETCERRDTKGLYKKARAGEIQNFTGINDPYEAPENPEIIVDTSSESPDESFQKIMNYIDKKLT